VKEAQPDPHTWPQKTLNNYVLPGSFLLRTARRLGEAWVKFPYEYDELMVHLSNKIKLLDVSIQRNGTYLGRLYNKFTGEDVDVIVLDGGVVKQLFDVIGEDPRPRSTWAPATGSITRTCGDGTRWRSRPSRPPPRPDRRRPKPSGSVLGPDRRTVAALRGAHG